MVSTSRDIAAGPERIFELIADPGTLFDGTIGAGWSWSRRDQAMAGRIPGPSRRACRHPGGRRQRAHPHHPHQPRDTARGMLGPPSAWRRTDPDPVWRRAVLQHRAPPVPPYPPRPAPAPNALLRPRPGAGSARRSRSGRTPATQPMATRPAPAIEHLEPQACECTLATCWSYASAGVAVAWLLARQDLRCERSCPADHGRVLGYRRGDGETRRQPRLACGRCCALRAGVGYPGR